MQYYKIESDYLFNIKLAQKGYDEDHLYLRFITGSMHKPELCVEKKGNLVVLSSKIFNEAFSINKLIEEKEFINDIRKMVGVMAYVCVTKGEIAYPLCQVLHEHIQKFGRLLSEDLNTYIAEFILVVDAFGKSESGEGLNANGIRNIISRCQDCVEDEFGTYLCE